LFDPSIVKAFWPPQQPAPHHDPSGTLTGATESAYSGYAAAAGALYAGLLGSIPFPFTSEVESFAGIAISGEEAFAADALVDSDEKVIAAVITGDRTVKVSRGGAVAWEGPLGDLLVDRDVELGDDPPMQELRFLAPEWPYGTLTLTVGGVSLVFRARVGDDAARPPASCPLVFASVGGI